MPGTGEDYAGYRIEREIGRGGMGVVYLAEHVHLQRRVALKLLPADFAQDESFRQRFIRESRLAASLNHPNIVPIYDAGDAEGLLYISMLYVDGGDLKKIITSNLGLDLSRTISLLDQVAGALDEAHDRGMVHRDVKPQNMLVERTRRGERAYLTDFGLTKRFDSKSGITTTGTIVGTVDYIAPEQLEAQPVDRRTDIYSLGCVLYECLSGKVPFDRPSFTSVITAHLHSPPPRLSDVRPDLPGGLEDVIARALAKSPDDRYATCGELIDAVRMVQSQEGTHTGRVRPGETVVGPAEPHLGPARPIPDGLPGQVVPRDHDIAVPQDQQLGTKPPGDVASEKSMRKPQGSRAIVIAAAAVVVALAGVLLFFLVSGSEPNRSANDATGATSESTPASGGFTPRSLTSFSGPAESLLPPTLGDLELETTDNSALNCAGGASVFGPADKAQELSQSSATYVSSGAVEFVIHNLCLYSSKTSADSDARATVIVRKRDGFTVVEEREVVSEDGARVGFAVLLERPNAGEGEIRESLVWSNGTLSASLNAEETGVVVDLFGELPY